MEPSGTFCKFVKAKIVSFLIMEPHENNFKRLVNIIIYGNWQTPQIKENYEHYIKRIQKQYISKYIRYSKKLLKAKLRVLKYLAGK